MLRFLLKVFSQASLRSQRRVKQIQVSLHFARDGIGARPELREVLEPSIRQCCHSLGFAQQEPLNEGSVRQGMSSKLPIALWMKPHKVALSIVDLIDCMAGRMRTQI